MTTVGYRAWDQACLFGMALNIHTTASRLWASSVLQAVCTSCFFSMCCILAYKHMPQEDIEDTGTAKSGTIYRDFIF